MKLIDSVEGDLHQAPHAGGPCLAAPTSHIEAFGGSDGKLAPWLSAEALLPLKNSFFPAPASHERSARRRSQAW